MGSEAKECLWRQREGWSGRHLKIEVFKVAVFLTLIKKEGGPWGQSKKE